MMQAMLNPVSCTCFGDGKQATQESHSKADPQAIEKEGPYDAIVRRPMTCPKQDDNDLKSNTFAYDRESSRLTGHKA